MNLFERPVDLKIGIVPLHADLALRIVKIRALVFDLSDLARHTKTMSEFRRNVNLPEIFSRQPDADPLPEMLRAAANIDRNIIDFAFDHPNQFPLRAPDLRMQASYSAALRT